MNMVVVYLASPRASAWSAWSRLDCLEASLKLLRQHCPPWPIIIFHEDYTGEDKDRLRAISPDITFEQVDFTGLENIHVNCRPDSRVGTYGYCMMCRFFAGQLQKHPSVQEYTHYMRLDDDSYIMEPLSQKIVETIGQADYSYRSVYQEDWKEAYDFVFNFMKQEGLEAPAKPYNRDSPYNNYHTSKLAMWRHPTVLKLLDQIETMGAHLRRGWTDTAVHAAIIWLLGPRLNFAVHLEKDFAYRHNQQCVHAGPHGQYCKDVLGGQYSWGPPACLEHR